MAGACLSPGLDPFPLDTSPLIPRQPTMTRSMCGTYSSMRGACIIVKLWRYFTSTSAKHELVPDRNSRVAQSSLRRSRSPVHVHFCDAISQDRHIAYWIPRYLNL